MEDAAVEEEVVEEAADEDEVIALSQLMLGMVKLWAENPRYSGL